MSRAHLFVDETKNRGFQLVVASVLATDVGAARKMLRAELLPRQRALHFKHESDSSRSRILRRISGTTARVTVYRTPAGMPELIARELTLRAMFRDAVEEGAELVVIDRDDSAVPHDRRWLSEEHRSFTLRPDIRFNHSKRHEEPLLAIPDAVGWCLQRGRPWTARVSSLVTRSLELS